MSERLSWVGSPDTRGTMDVLWGCLSTLGLCVWTAVHRNIQLHPTDGSNLSVRILLMLTAVVFPEILISAALRQRSLASFSRVIPKDISNSQNSNIVNDNSDIEKVGTLCTGATRATCPDGLAQRHSTRSIRSDEISSPSSVDSMEIDPTTNDRDPAGQPVNASSHEVVSTVELMTSKVEGQAERYVSDSKSTGSQVARTSRLAKWNRKQLYFVVMGGLCVELNAEKYFLTVDALPFLETAGCLPDLSVEDVDERSNADVITKLIVIAQTIWFATQIVARLASRLSITVLEVHTIVHVGCAIVMYALWWDKPYNVSRSITLTDKTTKDVTELLVNKLWIENGYQKEVRKHELDLEQYWKNVAESTQARSTEQRTSSPPPALRNDSNLAHGNNDDLEVQRAEERVPKPPQRQSVRILLDRDHFNFQGLSASDPKVSALMPAQRALMILLEKDSNVISRLDQVFDGVRTSSENFSALSVWGSWTEDLGHDWSFDKSMHVLFNVLYGAGHLAAWSSTSFPTSAERWLWRASSLMLVSILVWALIWILYWKATRSRSILLEPIRSGELSIVIGPLFCVVMVAYVLARCYFLVEALISLRSLPASAYQLVRWTYFLPHAG